MKELSFVLRDDTNFSEEDGRVKIRLGDTQRVLTVKETITLRNWLTDFIKSRKFRKVNKS